MGLLVASRPTRLRLALTVKAGPSKSGRSRRDVPHPQFVRPQLSQPVEKPSSGPQWLHEIKLDGYRMAARIDNGRAQLLTPPASTGQPNIKAPSRLLRTST